MILIVVNTLPKTVKTSTQSSLDLLYILHNYAMVWFDVTFNCGLKYTNNFTFKIVIVKKS